MPTPPTFAAGATLTAAQMNTIGWHLVKTQTIGTAVSTVAVTSAFSTDYDAYKIIVSGGVGSALTALKLQLGSTTTGYYGGLTQVTYAAGAVTGLNDNNAAAFSYVGVSNTTVLTVNADIFNPFLSTRTAITASYMNTSTTGSSGNYNGFLNNATSYTDFTIIPTTGTLTGGTIRVYGYRNSLT